MIELYKDGNVMGIATDEKTEPQFIEEISQLLGELIEEKEYEHDWEFQFFHWLPQIVDICCKYRGYKAPDVDERILYIAGDRIFGENPTHRIDREHTIQQIEKEA